MNSSAVAKREKSPASQTIPSADSVSIPRRQRSRPDQLGPGAPLSDVRDLALERLGPPVDEVERLQVVVERLLLGGERKGLPGQPGAAGDPPALGRHGALVAQQELRQPVTGAHPVEPGVLARPH
jgi:hypothetical protein